jgi:hypothetical protein
LPAQGSYRPVRAQLTHTVPQVTGSLCAAIRCCCGDTCRVSMHSPCFPPTVLRLDASLSSPGSPQRSSPVSTVLSRRYDSLPSFPPRFVSFARPVPRLHSRFAPARAECRRVGPGVVHPVSPSGLSLGDDRGSHVPGEPQCASALLSDPGRSDHTRPLTVRRHGPRYNHNEGSCELCLSRLNHTALALAVYASQGGLLLHHARLASGCWSGSAGRV